MSAWESLRARYAESADPLRTQRRIELVAVLLGLFICLQVVFGLFGLAVFSGPGAIEPAADSLRVPAVIAPGEVAAAERQAEDCRLPEVRRRAHLRHGDRHAGKARLAQILALEDLDERMADEFARAELALRGAFGLGRAVLWHICETRASARGVKGRRANRQAPLRKRRAFPR